MNLVPAVKQLKARLATIEAEHKRVADAIKLLTNLAAKNTKPESKPEPKRRKRGYVHKATCLRCGNLFKAKRHPGKMNTPQSQVLFCHKPCTSSMYNREKRRGAVPTKPFTTLLPSDPLRATMGQH